jgi:hypothetical protein
LLGGNEIAEQHSLGTTSLTQRAQSAERAGLKSTSSFKTFGVHTSDLQAAVHPRLSARPVAPRTPARSASALSALWILQLLNDAEVVETATRHRNAVEPIPRKPAISSSLFSNGTRASRMQDGRACPIV